MLILAYFHDNWQDSWSTFGLVKEVLSQTIANSTLELTPIEAVLSQVFFHTLVDNLCTFAQDIATLLHIDKATGVKEYLAQDSFDWGELKGAVRDSLAKYLFDQTKRRPAILPVVMEVR